MSREVLQVSKNEVNSSAENRGSRLRNPREIEECLEGKKLYGDEFSGDEVAAWFADEKEATTEIRGPDWQYKYHELNQFHAYERLPSRRFSNVLSLGGGDGSELLPIMDSLDRVTILESSENLRPAIKAQYVLPEPDGSIPFPDNTFDLITCLSVLHHIPNVSRVVREIYRCASAGGFVLLREPTISMGDWRKPREGLSKHERGIPLHLMRQLIQEVGFKVVSERRFCFAPIMYLNRKLKKNFYGSPLMLRLDSMLCKMPIWNRRYHAKTALEKFRPSGVFYVLTK